MNRPESNAFLDGQNNPSGQLGALCWRKHRGHVQVLLITSRDTGRWIIPKGWPHAEKTAAGSAAAEAWEEAGVEGVTEDAPLGLYSYDKVLRPGVVLPCIVTVFALRVARLRRRFPERRERQRKWFDAARAARKVAEPELRAMLIEISQNAGLLVSRPAAG
jgi:8-oxo-dGTP pyrophosphatase MutT (NUDIX family)